MRVRESFQPDGELDIAAPHNVLDLKVCEFGREAQLLDDAGVLAGSKFGVVLRLGPRDNHLARGEDEGSRLWLTDAHDDSSKALAQCTG